MTSDREELAKLIDPWAYARGLEDRMLAREIALEAADRIIAAGWTRPAPEVTEEMVERACEAWFGEGNWWFGYANPIVDVERSNGLAAKFRADMRAALTRALPVPEVTEGMVERACQWVCDHEDIPREDLTRDYEDDIRAMLTAALQPGEGSR